MRRICWIFPDRGTGRQRAAEEDTFWKPYARAALQAGFHLTTHAPETVVVTATDPTAPRVYVDGDRVTPADTVFVTELYTFPHQVVDVFNQVALFTVLEQAAFYLPIPPAMSLVANDKLATVLRVADAPLPVIPTVRIGTGRGGERDALELAVTVGFPAIVKPAGWGGGQGVCLVRTAEELRGLVGLAAGSECALVCQPYLGPRTTDFRVYMVDGAPHTVLLRRPPAGGVVANLAQGGGFELVDLPSRLVPALAYFAERFPVPYFCVDFLFDGDRFWISELEPDGAVGYLNADAAALLLEARFRAYARGHDAWLAARRDLSPQPAVTR